MELKERMKQYEKTYKHTLLPRMPIILRLDGINFSKYVKGTTVPYEGLVAGKKCTINVSSAGLAYPYDENLRRCLYIATVETIRMLSSVRMVYIFSDEVSLLICPYDYFSTEIPFNGNIQKMISSTASFFTAAFNHQAGHMLGEPYSRATFDCRCFQMPRNDVENYFYERWLSCKANAINMMARRRLTQEELQGKKNNDLMDIIPLEEFQESSTSFLYGDFIFDTNNPFNASQLEDFDRSTRLDIEELASKAGDYKDKSKE